MGEVLPPATTQEAVAATRDMYNAIPGKLGAHFLTFRELSGIHTAEWDMTLSHRLADVPLGKSNFVEIGPGDGRDAVAAFVPLSGVYTSFGPAENEQALARQNVAAAFPGQYSESALSCMFQTGFAQTAELPEDVDVVHAVNSFSVHTPFEELPDVFDNVGESLRDGGVFHVLTKAALDHFVEFNPGESFEGAEGMTPRTFYIPSYGDLHKSAEDAGLTVVHEELVEVPTKPWNWYTVAVQR